MCVYRTRQLCLEYGACRSDVRYDDCTSSENIYISDEIGACVCVCAVKIGVANRKKIKTKKRAFNINVKKQEQHKRLLLRIGFYCCSDRRQAGWKIRYSLFVIYRRKIRPDAGVLKPSRRCTRPYVDPPVIPQHFRATLICFNRFLWSFFSVFFSPLHSNRYYGVENVTIGLAAVRLYQVIPPPSHRGVSAIFIQRPRYRCVIECLLFFSKCQTVD